MTQYQDYFNFINILLILSARSKEYNSRKQTGLFLDIKRLIEAAHTLFDTLKNDNNPISILSNPDLNRLNFNQTLQISPDENLDVIFRNNFSQIVNIIKNPQDENNHWLYNFCEKSKQIMELFNRDFSNNIMLSDFLE